MKNQLIKKEKIIIKKIKGSRSHVELSARASYPPSRPLWSSRLRTQSRWQKTYFFVNVIFEEEIITASRVTSLLYGQTRLQNFFTVRQSYWAASSFEKKASPFSCENNCWLDFSKIFVMFFSSTQPENFQLVSFSRWEGLMFLTGRRKKGRSRAFGGTQIRKTETDLSFDSQVFK